MPKDPKEGKLLYHLTSLGNFESILEHGLRPRSQLNGFIDIADTEILEDRDSYNLGDYVPFHFFSSSPFAGSVQRAHEDEEFLYLTVRRVVAKRDNYLIVPSHPLHYRGELLTYEEGMQTIDWDLMAKRDYHNHECREVCMAECLAPGVVPFSHVGMLFVRSDDHKQRVSNSISDVGVNFSNSSILVCPGMFVSHD